MLRQMTTSTKRKHTGNDSSGSAKRARFDDNGSVPTKSIEGKRLQMQEEDKCEPPKIPLKELPMDVWWNVIDELKDDQDALVACALVCREWAPRSMRLLGEPIRLPTPADVRQLAKLGRTASQEVKSCRSVWIVPFPAAGSLRALGAFSAMFVSKMPLLRTLVVRGDLETEWKPGEMPVEVFHYLSTFSSITHLSLRNVIFPSVQTFGRLAFSLPSLKTLRCDLVEFKAHSLRPHAFLRRPRKLTTLYLGLQDLATAHDVSNFMATTEIASTLREIIIRRPIELYDLEESWIPALLSSAGASLRFLYLTLEVNSLPVVGKAPVVDFSKLINLERLEFAVETPNHNEDFLPYVMTWICNQLAGLPKPSAALRSLTLRLNLGTRPPHKDGALRHRSHVQHCNLLDDTLSTPPFMGLIQLNLEIQTYKLKATDKEHLEQLVPTRFPRLAARGIFKANVIDNLGDFRGIAEKRYRDGSYTIKDLELP